MDREVQATRGICAAQQSVRFTKHRQTASGEPRLHAGLCVLATLHLAGEEANAKTFNNAVIPTNQGSTHTLIRLCRKEPATLVCSWYLILQHRYIGGRLALQAVQLAEEGFTRGANSVDFVGRRFCARGRLFQARPQQSHLVRPQEANVDNKSSCIFLVFNSPKTSRHKRVMRACA